MSIKDALRNRMIEVAAVAINNKINGVEVMERMDEELDKLVGKGTSERLQRSLIADLLLEMVEGIYSEDKIELIKRVDLWQNKLRRSVTLE